MTPGTGKRSSRACLRCRRRKTKCDLDGFGEPQNPPCVSCHESGSECVLVQSRRGVSRPRRRSRRATLSSQTVSAERDTPGAVSAAPVTDGIDDLAISEYSDEIRQEDEHEVEGADEDLHMELRNPSDALQILARSGEVLPDEPRDHHSAAEAPSVPDAPTYPSTIRPSPSANTMITLGPSRDPTYCRPPTTVLDDYELVKRGLLHPSELPELLLIFAESYHPYCPIVPSYFLSPSAMERIQRPDYFLLTVILTIASRDSPNHSLTHRYCWDHAQRLLLEVLLAHSWAHTPRTVEGLLLLAEWLPHIQIKQTISKAPKNLFSEDRTAWSLVGLAVRQGYLLRLDRAAFRAGGGEPTEREEQKRLVWAFVYIADRQISVRLGQSFWSRGPSLSSQFTAKDFPSLKPTHGSKDEDYASVLHATLELTQILYNAHLILYSSTERTRAMISDGDYARYLDDFVRAAITWRKAWQDVQAPEQIKTTLLLMYEYVCLYVNAFSFQAVVTRASQSGISPQGSHDSNKAPLADLFSRGVMSSPDGIYVYGAISAAMNLLKLMNGFDPRRVLRFLPSRYYLYGVYAAVFLHKAQSAGAFQSTAQRTEVNNLALRFVSVMAEAASTESHVCHGYSRMLRSLWRRRAVRRASSRETRLYSDTASSRGDERCSDRTAEVNQFTPPFTREGGSQGNVSIPWDDIGGTSLGAGQGLGGDMSIFPSIEGYLFGSFFPGITDFDLQGDAQGMFSEQLDPWLEGFREGI